MLAHGDGRAGCTAGRFSVHSAMASFMRGASAWPPGEALAGLEGQQGRGHIRSSSWHHLLSQAGPEGRAGLPSPPGNQQRTLRRVEGVDPLRAVSADQQAFSSCLLGCTPFQRNPADAVPPYTSCFLSRDKSLLVEIGIPWHQRVLWAQGLFHSSVPTLCTHIRGPLGPWPRC